VYELVNPEYQRLFPERELQGRPILEAMPELVGHRAHETLLEVYQTGETHQEPALLVPMRRSEHGELEDRYFNYIQQARYNEHGQIDGILVFAFEVTGQVLDRQRADALQAEVLAGMQRIVQERESYYQVFEQTPASIVLLRGPQHRVEYHNEAYQQLFPGREMHGRTVAEIQPDALAQGFVALLDRVYNTGETFYGNELQLVIDQPGDLPPKANYFNFTYQAYRENGEIVGISVFAYEVGEQVRARQQREQNQRRLQLITDALPVLIGYIDQEEKYQFVNRGYEVWFKREPEEFLGRSARELLGAKAYQSIQPYIARALAGERLDFEARMPYRDDFIRYIRTSYVPEIQDGLVIGFYSMVTDITDQVLGRQQVEELNEELAAINEELQATNDELLDTNQQLVRTNVDLDNFIYTASHDLRSPIANIEGLLHALTQQLPEASATDAQVLAILQMMQGSVERFQKTIDHLTDLTKLQKEHVQLRQTVDLVAIVEEVRLDLAPLLESTSAQLEVDVNQCPTISFSQKNLRSVVYNLLSNALKYRHPSRQPKVCIRCQHADGYARLEVQDNGLGLDTAQQIRLFGMFQRLHDHVEGTGIGLYMVKRMVENAGGNIQVESQPGVGSTFTVSFPS
jgi:PAS domain S-box-containing protein